MCKNKFFEVNTNNLLMVLTLKSICIDRGIQKAGAETAWMWLL